MILCDFFKTDEINTLFVGQILYSTSAKAYFQLHEKWYYW